MLRFVTLVPVVLVVGAVLKIGGTKLDETLSARPLARDGAAQDRSMSTRNCHQNSAVREQLISALLPDVTAPRPATANRKDNRGSP